MLQSTHHEVSDRLIAGSDGDTSTIRNQSGRHIAERVPIVSLAGRLTYMLLAVRVVPVASITRPHLSDVSGGTCGT